MVNYLKKIFSKETNLIILIFFIALFSRFYKLNLYPVSLSMDEVSIGYNAYSILNTGKDEWGEKLPLAFRSAGDYKPPVNVYLTVPSIYLFGLNEWGVRFPTAFFGALSVPLLILLLKEIGFKKAGFMGGGFWLSVSPWHVHFSRGGFEAVTALFFLLLGTLLFFKSIKLKSYLYFQLSSLSFILSIWSYHAERLFVPLLMAFLVFYNWSKVKFVFNNRSKLFLVVFVSLVLFLPFIYITFFTDAVRERALSTSILREQSLIKELNFGSYDNFKDLIFDNDIYVILRHFMGKYFNYFDLKFWFWKGMHFTPSEFLDSGLFYMADMLFIIVGIYFLFKSKNNVLKGLSLFWFFAGPIPAAYAMNEQHALRALTWLPFFGLAYAAGFEYFNNMKNSAKIFFGYFLFLLLNLVLVSDIYFRQFPRFHADAWQYGYKEIALYACNDQEKYDKVYVTDTFGSIVPNNTGLPAEYILFYCKIDPDEFVYNNRKFDRIVIKRWQAKNKDIPDNSLVIGSYWDLLSEDIYKGKVIKTINYPSGKPAFLFLDTRREINEI